MTDTARLYGGSLYELAVDEKLSDIIAEQIGEIRRLFWENPDYARLLSEPSVPLSDRLGMIEQAFGEQAERYLINFLKLLCERDLLGEFAGCCEEYARRYDADNNVAEAVVTSAVPLSEEQKDALVKKLEQIAQKKIRLVTKTEAGVLAGLRVELEGRQLDGTVTGRMNEMSRRLKDATV